MAFNSFITSAESLVTSYEQTRAGFLSIALEKNKLSDPYVKNALAFKAMVAHTKSPDEFLAMPCIRSFLLTAAGLSDKSMKYLTEQDMTLAIQELIDKFLKPAGEDYIDEATFRYLLIKGDAVGGLMRNKIGEIGQQRLISSIFSSMDVRGMNCLWLPNTEKAGWKTKRACETGIESQVKALQWSNSNGSRILAFNINIPKIGKRGKNVDICLYSGNTGEYRNGKIANCFDRAIMLGELKGGIDPAGADEHWKTANTALARIRTTFGDEGFCVKTAFVGAAIEKAMASEIYEQLQTGVLDNSANLTNTNQLVEFCNWMLEL